MSAGMKMKTAKLVYTCSLLVAGSTILSAQQPPLAPTPTSPGAPAPATISAIGPKISFETPVYDFGRVKSGELVKHTFIFTNTGDELLILTNVQPSCGCTTAGDWTHQVEPGKTGTIPIQFNSANYSGQVLKTVTVTSNDKATPTSLQVKGTIWKPIDINPAFAVMNIPPDTDTNVTQKIHIVNNMEELVTLSPPEVNNKAFTATLVTNTAGKDFDVIVTALPPFEQPNIQAQITMKTSSTNMPNLSLTAWANVQQAVTISPPQLMIGAAPLAAKQTVTINVQNNSAKPLKITDPAIDIKDIDVQTTELSPGKTFTFTLNFPQGFELKNGKAEFTAKSDNPRFAQIKVPITQMAKPVQIPGTSQVVPLRPAGIPVPPAPAPPAPPASASTTKPSVSQ
jgi:hypothetical protein